MTTLASEQSRRANDAFSKAAKQRTRRRYTEALADEERAHRRYQEQSPEKRSQLAHLMQSAGITPGHPVWGDSFSDLSQQQSPAVALWCFYVVMGYSEVQAYRLVTQNERYKYVPRWFALRARPHVATLLARFMPSRTRLLANMAELMEDHKNPAEVRANMMQFLARYLLVEPGGVGAGLVGQSIQGAAPLVEGTSSIQSLIQESILRRGGVLVIPPPSTPAQAIIDVTHHGDPDHDPAPP